MLTFYFTLKSIFYIIVFFIGYKLSNFINETEDPQISETFIKSIGYFLLLISIISIGEIILVI